MAWRDLDPPPPPAPCPPPNVRAAFCVLASGSSGNCSVLRIHNEEGRAVRTALIDAGLSPTRTRSLLAERGVSIGEIDDIVLTHLDSDHCHPGWRRVKDCRATLRLHQSHTGRAQRRGLMLRRNDPFTRGFDLGADVRVEPIMMSHDHLGVAAFRFEISDGDTAASLGFATDLGRSTRALTDHLAGVGTLAIESNYCPRMQADSDRPVFLKKRITGGTGHLSNEECAEAVRTIAPSRDVVLLHLSRQCNTPDLAASPHACSPYTLTLSSQTEPTPWIEIGPSASPGWAPTPKARQRQGMLFSAAK